MESIIKKNITQQCLKNNLISPAQHGFVRGKSTVTNLLKLTKDISENVVVEILLILYALILRRLLILCLINNKYINFFNIELLDL